ncbi:MAG: DUF1570 domain-containing protein [Planctomycetota bacterium]
MSHRCALVVSLSILIAPHALLPGASPALASVAPRVQPADEVFPGAKRVESRSYEIVYTVPDEEIVPIGRHMDAVHAEYSKRMRGFKPRNNNRSPLYVFATQEQYMAYLATQGIDGSGSAGMFYWRGEESGLVVFTEGHTERSLNALLQHEGFHQFARQRLGEHLPTWANEGLAEYFERGVVEDGEFRTGYASDRDVQRLRELVREGELIGTEDLLTMASSTWNHNVRTSSGDAWKQYLQAWAFVQFFVHADRGRYQPYFLDFMKKLAQGQDAPTAFKRAFRVRDFSRVDAAYRTYLDRELRQGLPVR